MKMSECGAIKRLGWLAWGIESPLIQEKLETALWEAFCLQEAQNQTFCPLTRGSKTARGTKNSTVATVAGVIIYEGSATTVWD